MALDSTITGIHHITVIAGDPQEHLDFSVGVLGMRLVKKTVNQDVLGTYHLFYADGAAHPGTDLTFFPWPDMERGRRGIGFTVDVALDILTKLVLPPWLEPQRARIEAALPLLAARGAVR